MKKAKNCLAKISVKAITRNLNPKRPHLHRENTIDDVIKCSHGYLSLGDFMTAAASATVSAERLSAGPTWQKNFRKDPIYVKALQVAAESGVAWMHQSYDYTHIETTASCGCRGLQGSGIKNPRERAQPDGSARLFLDHRDGYL